MISFPPCKINLGLNIISKRADGYHDIETCFYPVPWTDILEIVPSKEFSFTSSGTPIPGANDQNLCVKAYQLLQQDFDLPPVSIHLHKILHRTFLSSRCLKKKPENFSLKNLALFLFVC